MFSSLRRLLPLACLCAGARSIGLRSAPLIRHGQLHALLVLPYAQPWQSESLIGGLLNARQQCDPGESDCDDGCCPSGYYCDPPGCCPNGETCDGIIGGCPESGDTPCGLDTCCRAGQTCTSDLDCVDGGGGGGGGGGTTPHKTTTTQKTTTIKAATTTHVTTSGASTGSTSVPNAPAGSQNIVIDVSTNTDIMWEGNWVAGPSSCASGGQAMSIGGNSLDPEAWMSYDFTGTAIFVSIASNNVEFGITLDTDEMLYIGDATAEEPSNCTFGWQRTGLSAGTHNLFIDPLGAKLDLNSDDINPPWYFELQNFVITQPDSATTSDNIHPEPTTVPGPSTAPKPTTAPDQGPGSGPAGFGSLGAAYKNSVSWLFTAVMIFLAVYLL